jgi:hypothetical protein
MNKLLFALVASLIISTSAFAGDGTTPIILFFNHDSTGDQIVTAKSSNYSTPTDVYDFTPTNGDTIPSHYSNNYPSPGYTYSYVPPTPPPQPNIAGFLGAVSVDPLTTTNNCTLKFQLAGILALFQTDMAFGPAALQADWINAIALYGPSGTQGTWLTTQVQSMLLGYALTYNIPLVASP